MTNATGQPRKIAASTMVARSDSPETSLHFVSRPARTRNAPYSPRTKRSGIRMATIRTKMAVTRPMPRGDDDITDPWDYTFRVFALVMHLVGMVISPQP